MLFPPIVSSAIQNNLLLFILPAQTDKLYKLFFSSVQKIPKRQGELAIKQDLATWQDRIQEVMQAINRFVQVGNTKRDLDFSEAYPYLKR